MTGWRWGVLRLIFLLAIAAGAWLSLRGSGDKIADSLADVSPGRVLDALLLTLAGLAVSGWIWRQGLETVVPADSVDRRAAWSVFFVGQLGKYIPGSVWSFGAQAVLAKRAGMGSRAVVTASGLFLAVHVASGVLLSGLVGGPSALDWWMRLGLVLAGAGAMAPAVMHRLGARLAGAECRWRARTALVGAVAMLAVWLAYAASLALLAGTGEPGEVRVLLTGFALGYVAGILVPLAPAGLGAREVVFVSLVAPALGLGAAAALAIVSRVVQIAADLIIAGAAAAWARRATAG